jgi:hypothetical protein
MQSTPARFYIQDNPWNELRSCDGQIRQTLNSFLWQASWPELTMAKRYS